ncbi:DUF4347 domain-containing protein [Phenylobacterium zucineum]|uniref:DUF4347 domain-containing protein n=1 Tax=Phenylobacterium zucineum TaxID=284016 RepID=UPI000674110F|nr:DUF4347 domain-containing protein [Phenylobacterium zucineum]
MPHHAAPARAPAHDAELLFILSDVPHIEVLLAGLREGVEVQVLPESDDGLSRIAEALRTRRGLEAIHLVSHGEPGALTLGSLRLDRAGLGARSRDLAAFGQALGPAGQVLVYGCRAGAGTEGRAFVAALAQAMGARVAASATPTGGAGLGGDWNLDVASDGDAGSPAVAFVTPALEAYAGLLAANTPPTLEGVPWPWPTAAAGATVEAPDLTVGDADGDLLEVTLSPGFGLIGGVTDEDPTMAGVQLRGTAADLNSKLAGLTFTPDAEGFAWINISVTDGIDVAAGSLMYNVSAGGEGSGDGEGGDPPAGNRAPSILVPIVPQPEAPAGVEIEVLDPVVEDLDDDPLLATLTSYNGVIGGLTDADPDVAGIQLSGSAAELTALLSGMTFTADRGDDLAWIDIAVSDGALSASGVIMMTATGGNAAPAFAGLNDADSPAPVAAGRAVDLPDFTVSDADGDSLVLTIIPGAIELIGLADADGEADGIQLVGTAEEINAQLAAATVKVDQGGLDFLQMSLEDGRQLFPTWGTLWLSAPPNASPTLHGLTLDDVTVRWGVASPLPDFTVADADDDPLTVTLVAEHGEIAGAADADEAAEGLQLVGDAGEINAQLAGLTYTAGHKGHGLIRVEVTDGRDETITWINLWAKANGAPSISGAPAEPLKVLVGAPVALTGVAVSDPDGDPLTVTLVAVNGLLDGVTDTDPEREGVQLAGSAAEINVQLAAATFTAAAPGPARVDLHVSDGLAAEPVTRAIELDVTAPSPPPEPEPPPPPPPPPTSNETIDGVPVQTGTVTNPDGSTSQVITIPVVTSTRPEQVGDTTVADIPLVTGGSGPPPLLAQVPVGLGLQATGPGAPQPAGNSLADLIRAIQTHTAPGSTDQIQLTGGGSGFLQGLSPDAPLIVQTLTPTAPTGVAPPTAPLVISGAPIAPGTPNTALVIDTRSLPSGVTLQLDNVGFAAVVGAARVIGGAGSQSVWGDGADQSLFLGADDDVLHGGGGADTVASAGGDDRLFGDDGDDAVSGGEGADQVWGGAGEDHVHGNVGDDFVHGGEGRDTLHGGQGHDVVRGGQGDDIALGDLGYDTLFGDLGADVLQGGAGDDVVWGGGGLVPGADAGDWIDGGEGSDFVHGNQGDDTVLGGLGADVVHGGQGADRLEGGDGADTLSGDQGDDVLIGGAGADRFLVFAGGGVDRILDFDVQEGDRLHLDAGLSYTLRQDGADTIVGLGGGQRVVLADVRLETLGDGWIVGG